MTKEEKLEEAKRLYKTANADQKYVLERLFPELKESEDEKTKRILHSISNKMSQHLRDIFSEEEFQCFDAWSNAWLENRGEQKPTWSEEDEKIMNQLHSWMKEFGGAEEYTEKVYQWIKGLLEKQGEQPKKNDVCNNCDQQGSCVSACPMKLVEKQGEQPAELPKVKSVPLSFKKKLGIFMQYTSVDLEKEENKQLLDEAAKELLQLAYSDKANEIALASAKTWEESMAILIAANNAYRRGQKEQNPAWSEEDELHIKELDSLVKQVWATAEHENDKDTIHKMSDLSFFLKTLKPQLKQEWSEEDEKLFNDLSDTYFYNDEDYPEETYKRMLKKVLDWMNKRAKSLRPQSHWKPSDEHYELEEFAKIVRGNLTGISKAVQELFKAKYLQLTGNRMYGGFKD